MDRNQQSGNVADQRGRASIPDAELIGRIEAGEKHLFHALVRPYERAVYVVAFSILRSEADAEEVAQETFVRALTHLHQLLDPQDFKPWLMQIATNEARMRRRKDRKHLYESLDVDQESEQGEFIPREFADWRDDPGEALERKEVRTALTRALQALPRHYREVFVLRDVQQLSVKHTAAILGIGEPAVKTRLHRARLMLREKLAPMFRRRWTDRFGIRKGLNPWLAARKS